METRVRAGRDSSKDKEKSESKNQQNQVSFNEKEKPASRFSQAQASIIIPDQEKPESNIAQIQVSSIQRENPTSRHPQSRGSSREPKKPESKVPLCQISSSNKEKYLSKLPQCQASSSNRETPVLRLRRGRVCSKDKENAHLPCTPDHSENVSEAHYQDSASASVNDDLPIVREEGARNDHMENTTESSQHMENNGGVRRNDLEDIQSNKKSRLECEAEKRGSASSSGQSLLTYNALVKQENVCYELPVYNDIAMDPSLSDQCNVIGKRFGNSDCHLRRALTETSPVNRGYQIIKTTSRECQSLKNYRSENYINSRIVVVDKMKSKAFIEDKNGPVLTLHLDKNESDSPLQIDEESNYSTNLVKTKLNSSMSRHEESVMDKNGMKNDKSAKVTVELVPSCNMDSNPCKEQDQRDVYHRDGHIGNDIIEENISSAVYDKSGKPMMLHETASRNVSMGEQASGEPSINRHLQSEDNDRHFQQAGFTGRVRQPGDNNIIAGTDHNNNRLVKSETMGSQFNLFPTEKDVMAAVYQNTAETSHLTNGGGLNNSLNHPTSVVSTHSGYGSYLAGDLQTSTSFSEGQGSHSKWFANQVNLAAALCVANNNSYQDVHISSSPLVQRSPQQRSMFSPSGQKDFSQFVLQSPKPNIQGHQNISPSMLCSPSTNLFDSLMYQSENPFSPSGSRHDGGRNYNNVQDLDELMSTQQLQQSVPSCQRQQQQCYINNTSQQANRSQDLNWNNMNQSNSLPGVASLLPSAQGSSNNTDGRSCNIVLSGNSSANHNAYLRDRYPSSVALPNMGNVGIENVRLQKNKKSLLPSNNVVMEEYTAEEYQEMLQRSETGQGQGNKNWNANPQDEPEGTGSSNPHKTRPRKQSLLGESRSSPHLGAKQPTSSKGTKRSHSNTDNNSSPSTKKVAPMPNDEESKGYVNYQIASTIHTLKPRHIVSWYIDFLIKQNESITDMSHSYSIPAGIFDDRDFYFMESLVKRLSFPTKKFTNWMQEYFPSININAIDFREGRRRPPIVRDEAKYWSERTQVDIINEVFYHFQSVRDQK